MLQKTKMGDVNAQHLCSIPRRGWHVRCEKLFCIKMMTCTVALIPRIVRWGRWNQDASNSTFGIDSIIFSLTRVVLFFCRRPLWGRVLIFGTGSANRTMHCWSSVPFPADSFYAFIVALPKNSRMPSKWLVIHLNFDWFNLQDSTFLYFSNTVEISKAVVNSNESIYKTRCVLTTTRFL